MDLGYLIKYITLSFFLNFKKEAKIFARNIQRTTNVHFTKSLTKLKVAP